MDLICAVVHYNTINTKPLRTLRITEINIYSTLVILSELSVSVVFVSVLFPRIIDPVKTERSLTLWALIIPPFLAVVHYGTINTKPLRTLRFTKINLCSNLGLGSIQFALLFPLSGEKYKKGLKSVHHQLARHRLPDLRNNQDDI